MIKGHLSIGALRPASQELAR